MNQYAILILRTKTYYKYLQFFRQCRLNSFHREQRHSAYRAPRNSVDRQVMVDASCTRSAMTAAWEDKVYLLLTVIARLPKTSSGQEWLRRGRRGPRKLRRTSSGHDSPQKRHRSPRGPPKISSGQEWLRRGRRSPRGLLRTSSGHDWPRRRRRSTRRLREI